MKDNWNAEHGDGDEKKPKAPALPTLEEQALSSALHLMEQTPLESDAGVDLYSITEKRLIQALVRKALRLGANWQTALDMFLPLIDERASLPPNSRTPTPAQRHKWLHRARRGIAAESARYAATEHAVQMEKVRGVQDRMLRVVGESLDPDAAIKSAKVALDASKRISELGGLDKEERGNKTTINQTASFIAIGQDAQALLSSFMALVLGILETEGLGDAAEAVRARIGDAINREYGPRFEALGLPRPTVDVDPGGGA